MKMRKRNFSIVKERERERERDLSWSDAEDGCAWVMVDSTKLFNTTK
jgi:hypothetical protein